MEAVGKMNQTNSTRNYSLMTAILFWCGLVVVSSLYITIPLVSVFAGSFKVSPALASWTSSAFSLCYAVGFLFLGSLSDRYGRKQMMCMGLVVLAIISLLIGFLDSITWLIIFRGLQGMSAAIFAPAALAYVVEMFPTEKRTTTIGFVSSGFLMAGIVGQLMSNIVNQHFGWNYVFYFLGGIYFITVFFASLLPKDEVEQTKASILEPFKQIGMLLTQKSLFLCYTITITLLLSFVGMYTVLGSYLSSPLFNLESQNILYVRAIGMVGMLLSPFAGHLITKFRIHIVLRASLFLAVFGLAMMGIYTDLSFVVIMSIVFVTGISLTVPTLISLVGQLGGVARGVAIALYTFILFIGATLGPIIAVGLLKSGSYLLTFEVLALLLGIGLIISFFIKSQNQE